jgi:hypothetical protein
MQRPLLLSHHVIILESPLQRLKTLCGVGGHLPLGLPSLLETLEYVTDPAGTSKRQETWLGGFDPGSKQQAAIARTILSLANLKWLTTPWESMHLPLSFVARLPATVQVRGSAALLSCACKNGGLVLACVRRVYVIPHTHRMPSAMPSEQLLAALVLAVGSCWHWLSLLDPAATGARFNSS